MPRRQYLFFFSFFSGFFSVFWVESYTHLVIEVCAGNPGSSNVSGAAERGGDVSGAVEKGGGACRTGSDFELRRRESEMRGESERKF